MKISIYGFNNKKSKNQLLDTIDTRDLKKWVAEQDPETRINYWEYAGGGYSLFSYIGEAIEENYAYIPPFRLKVLLEVFEITENFDDDYLDHFRACVEAGYVDIGRFSEKTTERIEEIAEACDSGEVELYKVDSWKDLLWEEIERSTDIEYVYGGDDIIQDLITYYITEDNARDYLQDEYDKTSYGFLRKF